MLTELVIATHNSGKAKEISELLEPYVQNFYTSAELKLPEPEETGATFSENAKLKALIAAKESGKPALADDSGLSVNALDGAPGIYSARWGGDNKDFDMAMNRVHVSLDEAKSEDRSAEFVCALALAYPDGNCEVFEGRTQGTIISPARGDMGFGYDPIFQPNGSMKTFAETTPEEKQKLSHRAKAFGLLVKAVFKQG